MSSEDQRLKELEAKFGGLSPDEAMRLAQLEAKFGGKSEEDLQQFTAEPETSAWDTAKSAAGTALDYGLRGLDYAGGLTRTAAAEAADAFVDGNKVTYEDWLAALKGQAPTTSEHMDRMGVPEGASMAVPFLGDISVRDAAGFTGDILLDPLTYGTLGASALAKTGKAGQAAAKGLTAASRGTKATGKNLYKSGLKNIDKKIVDTGAKPFSDVMWERGVTGTNKSIQKQADAIADALGKERIGLYQKADDLGVITNPDRATQAGRDVIESRIMTDPGLEHLADDLYSDAAKYAQHGPVPVSRMSEWKTNTYNALPNSAFDARGKVKGPAQKYSKAKGSGFRQEILEQTSKADPKLGQRIDLVNEDMGSLMASQKPLAGEVSKAETKNLFTSVDGALAGYGLANPMSLIALGAKKAADVAGTTVFRTKTGKLVNQFGETLAPDLLGRQMLIEANRPEQASPWTMMDY